MNRLCSATETIALGAGVVAFSMIHCRINVDAGMPRAAACSRTLSTNDWGSRIEVETITSSVVRVFSSASANSLATSVIFVVVAEFVQLVVVHPDCPFSRNRRFSLSVMSRAVTTKSSVHTTSPNTNPAYYARSTRMSGVARSCDVAVLATVLTTTETTVAPSTTATAAPAAAIHRKRM